ncbi:MAG: cation:proton antiporter [Lentimicrobiaceae bacterium]|jgi:NhaP-type Na+/H+ or K+/H+ antiporter|nr:cation:proton antiporter [Lentimicrobiaceae bacterium]
MNIAVTVVAIGLLVFLSHAFAIVFSKVRVPDVLLLMLIGILLGPILGVVSPEVLGVIGSVFTTVTLVVILFEGGTELKFDVLRSSIKGMTLLTSMNFFVTMITIGLLGWLFFDMNILLSFMLGAILGGTSSAVVIPMVRQINMAEKSKVILILESAFTDVLCIVFALAFFEAIKLGHINVGEIIGRIVASFVLATILGIIGAIFWAIVLHRVRTVQNSIFTTPAFVFIIYGITELLGYSGAIASLAFGIGMANIDRLYNSFLQKLFPKKPNALNKTEKLLFSELVFLLKTFFFVMIGISIQFTDWKSLLIGFGITTLLYLLRIPIVRASMPLRDKEVKNTDLMYMASMVPKGLAAAVLASIPLQEVLGSLPEAFPVSLQTAEMIRNVVFSVILFSIIFTSILIPLIEKSSKVQRFYKNALNFNRWIRSWIQKNQLNKKRKHLSSDVALDAEDEILPTIGESIIDIIEDKKIGKTSPTETEDKGIANK